MRKEGGNIRLIVTDLDDTLLRSDHLPSEFTVETFRMCREKGILTAFATARVSIATKAEYQALKPDIRVVSNGAMALAGEELLFFDRIPVEEANQFCRCLKQKGAKRILAGCFAHTYWENREIAASRTLKEAVYHDFSEPIGEDAAQISFSLEDPRALGEVREAFPELSWTSYRGGRCAVMAPGVSKAAGVAKAAELFGVKLSEILAFGDDAGDLEMLTKCGVGVAMGNAIPELKEAADYVAETNDEDGAAKFIRGYIV